MQNCKVSKSWFILYLSNIEIYIYIYSFQTLPRFLLAKTFDGMYSYILNFSHFLFLVKNLMNLMLFNIWTIFIPLRIPLIFFHKSLTIFLIIALLYLYIKIVKGLIAKHKKIVFYFQKIFICQSIDKNWPYILQFFFFFSICAIRKMRIDALETTFACTL